MRAEEIQVLALGAHADDIEIGCGGTVAHLVASGLSVWICILTDDKDPALAARRRHEATAAARELGVDAAQVLFCGLSDGKLKANDESVTTLRNALEEPGVRPRLVLSHRQQDSHNDHRAAAEIALAAIRQACFLHYSVPNSGIVSDRAFRMFVDTSAQEDGKKRALAAHKSQDELGRIYWSEIEAIEHAHGARIAADIAEAFEVTVQEGGDDVLRIVRSLNDCPFHRFWYGLLGDQGLCNIHAVPVVRRERKYEWPTDKDREGMAELRRAFKASWYGAAPLEEFSCGTERIEQVLYQSHVLLGGGAVSNGITRNYFNHFSGLRYVIDYDMPNYENIRILDRKRATPIEADYEVERFGNKVPKVDHGILTVMRSPVAEGRCLLGCMGIHGYGSFGCYRALSERKLLRELLGQFKLPPDHPGCQVIVDYNVRQGQASFDWSTLHVIPE